MSDNGWDITMVIELTYLGTKRRIYSLYPSTYVSYLCRSLLMAPTLSSAVLSDCRPDPPSSSWCRLSLVELAALEALGCTREASFDLIPLPGAVDGRERFGVDCLDDLPILPSFLSDIASPCDCWEDVRLEWVEDALDCSGVTLFDFLSAVEALECAEGVCFEALLFIEVVLCALEPLDPASFEKLASSLSSRAFSCVDTEETKLRTCAATPTCPICSCMAACYTASEYHDLYLFFQPPPGLGSSVNYPLSPQRFEVISCRHGLSNW